MAEEAKTNETRTALQAQLDTMRSVTYRDARYYCLTLRGSSDGKICWDAQTVFAGWSDGRPRRELRVPCKVDPSKMLDLLTSVGQPCLVVNEPSDLFLYLNLGGHGIIRADIAELHLPDLLQPVEAVRSTAPGYLTVGSLPRSRLQRAPSKKDRMRVLKRDRYRCRVCGRSPDNQVDIELHVHHIRPWGRGAGGLTEDDNLITLCGTCHDGLEPHFDPALYSRIGVDPFRLDADTARQQLIEGTRAYRAIVRCARGRQNGESE